MSGKRLSVLSARLKNSLLALLFVGTQLVFPLGMSGAFIAHASAAQKCTVDSAGANDVSGQKDLTQMCSDTANLPVSEHITWNWDELGVSGNGQSLDACALFDTNGNGNANYSACVSATGNPANSSTLTIYSCNDASTEKCLGNTVVPSSQTTCSVSQLPTDPFPADSAYPLDTVADCTVFLSEVGGQSSAALLDVCSYPSGQPNSDPSDCIVAQASKAKLEVIKSLSPSNDPGLFDLKIDGTTDATGVSNGGNTGEVEVDASHNNSHTVSEAANTNSPTALSAYSSSIVCKDLHGTGTTIASGSGTSLGAISVADGSDVVCTITNTRQTGSITLIKSVTENNGGTAGVNDFGLSIGGTSVTSGQTLTLNPGNYAINEAGKTGYQFVSLTGTGCPSTLGGNVTLAANQNVTCTITNDDIAPSLTVVKNVTNDNGGTATADQFTLRTNGTQLTNGVLSNSNLTDTYTQPNPQAGTAYTVSEDSFNGYTSSGFTCTDNSTHANVGNPVTLSLGQNVTCTVTNNDNAPQLTLVKQVVNDNGGTNTAGQWTLKAQHSTDPAVINQQGTESNGGLTATTSTISVNANTGYTLSESGPGGYSPSSWNCNGGNLANNAITLGVGDNVTCTITNNDIAPVLTVTKIVNDNNGGTLTASDFPLMVTGSSGTTQVTTGVQYTFNAGQYTVSETQQSGYTLASISGDCMANGSITMVVGGVYSCTLTNNDVPANITVTKVVHNNHGGTAKVSDFNLFVGNTQVTSGVTNTFAANQQYTISETTAVNGYHQDSIVCTDTDTNANLGSTFTPTLAENIACTITNSDIAPQLTVIKHVVNDNGGQATADQFTMNVTGTNVSSNSFPGAESPGTTVTLNAGGYGVDESGGPSGYTKSIGQNCSGTIALGDKLICTITNDDQAPSLTVVKNVTNDNGGNNAADSFTVKVNGSALSSGNLSNGNLTDTYTVPNVSANTAYTVSENDPSPGYTQTSLVCKDNATKATVSNPVSLSPGQNVTCTIANDDVGPTLKVVKNVTNDNGGTTKADAFTLRVNGSKLVGGNLSNSDQTDTYSYANAQSNTTYTLSEDGFFGYTPSAWSCTDTDTQQPVTLSNNNSFSLNEGQNVTCSITNDDIAPSITVNKVIDPSNDNGLFDLSVNGVSNNFSSTTIDQTNGGTTGKVTVTNGTYTVSEAASSNSPSALTDYTTTWSCDNGTTGTGTTSDNFSVGSGDAVSCTFFNTRLGSIVIIKDAQPNSNQTFNFTGSLGVGGGFSLVDDGSGIGNSQTFGHLSAGTYTVTEPTVKGWSLIDINCQGGSNVNTNTRNAVIKLSAGENVSCTFVNQAVPPTLTVIKHVDNTNGNNAVASDFTMHVTNTASPNDASFPGAESPGKTVTMNTGDYTVTEDTLPGYTATFSGDCTGTLTLGDNNTCTITNTSNVPSLNITKTNDRPNPTVDGDTVTYTLVVTAPTTGGTDFDTTVTDLPPDNFTYVPGSWTSVLTDTNNSTTDLRANGTTTEPTYGSPGIWNLGTLKPGQKITLTYKAKIGGSVSNGTYPDLAFTTGCSTPLVGGACTGNTVTGNLNATSPFVSSQVTVAAVIAPATFVAGQVLGAEVLVNTGTNLLAAQYILPIILVLGIYITRRMSEEKGGK